MTNRSARAAGRFVFILCCVTLPTGVLRAQNENETVGFRANHAFESGNFGENIDILNGGLNLATPIGPHFQINSRLGYGVTLSYNSKVWDTTYYGTDWIVTESDQVVSINQGPFGIGFSGHFGRIFKDMQYIDGCSTTGAHPNKQCPGFTTSYTWVSPDGSQHLIHYDPWLQTPPYVDPGPPWTRRPTNDLSYALITGPYTANCPNGKTDGCFKVETPDGLTYTLERQVDCITPPDGRDFPTQYVNDRAFNLNFCGWYTTLIEDRSTTQPNSVRVTYDTRSNFQHAIVSVTDSVGRVTKFFNCEWRENGSVCVPGSDGTGYEASSRAKVATYRIDLPVFSKDAPGLDPLKVASYSFQYELATVRRAHPLLGVAYTTDPVLKLIRIDYPDSYPRNSTLPDQYSLYFGYSNTLPACSPGGADADGAPCEIGGYDGSGDYAELTCRTLPLLRTKAGSAQITGSACSSSTGDWATYKYTYGYYFYVSAYAMGGIPRPSCAHGKECGAGSGNGDVLTGVTRHLINKRIDMPQGTILGGHRWRYYRFPTSVTNPSKVIVKDPFLNDTVYFYHYSSRSTDPLNPGGNPEDGFAPEWNDGSNHRTDYYEGSESTGKLVRFVLQDHDADPYQADSSKHAKDNVRVKLETTIHQDDGGRELRVSRNTWDWQGHWLTEIESGTEVPAPRITTRSYQQGAGLATYRTGNLLFEEVSDGLRVLSRVDNVYDMAGKGRLLQSLSKANPGAPLAPYTTSPVQKKGDLKTTYNYSDASGNVIRKDLSTDPALGTTYSIKYTYTPATTPPVPGGCIIADECGGYLARKAFLDLGSVRFWSIKRDRDVNTGLIKRTYDTADFYTDYAYDTLGRLTDVTPQGEEAAKVDYPSLTETTLTQGDATTSDYVFTRYRYDGLGRQVAVEKRPSDPTRGYACQTTKYDVMSRVVFKSESAYVPQGTCAPGFSGEVGTTYSFQESSTGPTDPFGRVRREIPADATETTGAKVVQTKYFGTSSQVMVNNVMGPNQKPFPEITTFYHDAFGRLVMVEAPAGNRCSLSAKACATDANCPTGESCMTIDGGANAFYTYDALDDLTRVDLTEGITTQTRRFAYDGLKRLKSAENPENGVTVYNDYDPLGNILSVQDASGNIRRLDYDFAGRPRHMYLLVPGGTEKTVYENRYDESAHGNALGKLTTVLNDDEGGLLWLTEGLTYSGLGGRLSDLTHVFKEYSPASTPDFTETTSYVYDTRGQLSSLTYPIESAAARTRLTVNHAYQNGTVVSATEVPPPGCTPSPCTGTVLGRLTYSAAGAVEQLNTPGGGRTWITYDARNRPFMITGGKYGTSNWTREDYEAGVFMYDGAGNIQSMGSIHDYGYDAANRLIYSVDGETSNLFIDTFAYDAFGNMTRHYLSSNGAFTEIDDFNVEIPGLPKSNRIVSRTTSTNSGLGLTPSDPVPFTYDTNGNVIEGGRRWRPYSQSIPTEDIMRYDYNPLNQLRRAYRVTSVTSPVNPKTMSEVDRLFYDSGGNRIAKIDRTAGVKTYYVRDQSGQVLTELQRPLGETTDPEWQKDYLYIGGRMLGLKENLRPRPIKNLRVTQKINPVTIAWDPSGQTGIASYNVYRKRDPQDTVFTLQANLTGTSYSDPTTYSNLQIVNYRVAAKKSNSGYESGGTAIKVTVGDNTPPSAPVLSAIAGDGGVTLSWTASTDSSGIAGYEIDRRTDTSQPITPLTSKPITDTVYTDLGLTNGTRYYYLVKAVDTAGNSGTASTSCNRVKPSDPCDLAVTPNDLTPPGPPRGLKLGDECEAAGATQDTIKISWDLNAAPDNVASYEIYRSADPATLNTSVPIVTGLSSSTTMYTDLVTTPTPPYTWYYAMKALDAAGNKSSLSEIRSILPRDRTRIPQARLSVRASDALVTVSWNAVAGEGTYLVYRKQNASKSCGDYVFIGEGGSSAPIRFTDVGMPNNVAYDYAVTSKVSGVESTFSSPVLAVPLDKASVFKQCTRRRGGGYSVTDLQWDPIAARPYQPILASTAGGTVGYLKGYHLYHHQLCNRRLTPANEFQDNNLIRELVARPGDTNDPYLLATDQADNILAGYEWEAPRFYAPDWTESAAPVLTFSPPLANSRNSLFLISTETTCNLAANHQCYGCMMPKGVYKIYAEGTWLTAESDWPDYFDPLQEIPSDRCLNRLLPATSIVESPPGQGCAAPPSCGTAALKPPKNVKAVATAGTVTVSWEPVEPTDGSDIAGYHVYGRPVSPAQGFGVQPPLPFVTVGPGQTNITLKGLEYKTNLGGGWKFNVASFDSTGRVSLAYNGQCYYTGEVCTEDGQCGSVCRISLVPTSQGCSTYHRCTTNTNTSCRKNSDCPAGDSCPPGWCSGNFASCYPDTAATDCPAGQTCNFNEGIFSGTNYCEDAAARICTLTGGPCTLDSDCPQGRGYCSVTTGRTCNVDSDCPITEICQRGEQCRSVSNDAITAGVTWAQKSVVWTLNDVSGYPVNRKGIKLAWQQVSGVNGYRVYRSLSPDAPQTAWCVLLKQGSNPPGLTLCGNGDPLAFSSRYSTGPGLVGSAPTPYYWDTTVTPGVVYYYRVTSVSSSDVESAFSSSPVLSAKQLDYDSQVPPPPSGFKAWAPSSGPDMLGVYVSWCKDAVPDSRAPDAALPPSKYVVYRSPTSGGPYTHKVNIPSACLNTDGSGNRINRCEIKGSPTLQNGLFVYPDPVPQGSGCGGKPCAIVDLTFNSFPTKTLSVSQQNLFNYYYVVTAVGPNGKESRTSFENAGYLNYCGAGSGCIRRDADGNGDYPVCGERASLESSQPTSGTALSGNATAREDADDGEFASYRIIGQDAVADQTLDVTSAPLVQAPDSYTPPARFVFYVLDHLGSVRAVLDASANLVSTHHYLPFGEERPNLPQSSLNSRFFTGHERDKEDGLDYMLARYYSSSLGRFMAVDPVGDTVLEDPQSWNSYVYVRNNPLAYIDPEGTREFNLAEYIGSQPMGVRVEPEKCPTNTCPGDDHPNSQCTETSDCPSPNDNNDDRKYEMNWHYHWAPEKKKITEAVVPWYLTFVALESAVENPKLLNIIKNLAPKAGDTIPGGTFGAVAWTLMTGKLVGGSDHIAKTVESINGLRNLLASGTLNPGEAYLTRIMIVRGEAALATQAVTGHMAPPIPPH